MADKIDFWFDPSCPWCWMTSRWIAEEIVPNRDVDVTWHVLSLTLLNEGRDLDPGYAKHIEEARLGAQVSVGVGEVYGQEAQQYVVLISRRWYCLLRRCHSAYCNVRFSIIPKSSMPLS